ncbi:MAG: O-antigen ligase family protein, partial [Bacteroidota bacterium]
MAQAWHYIQQRLQLPTHGEWLLAYLLLVLGSVFLAIGTEEYLLLLIPVALVTVAVALVDFSWFYWLLLFTLPFSTEVYLPGGLGTDLPTEPLMVGLMGLFSLFVLRNLGRLSLDILRHPLTLLLLLHLGWIGVTTLTSDLFLVSVKFLLAKVWYVVTFFALTAYLVRSPADFRKFFWVFFSGYALMVIIIFVRHALLGFHFMGIHSIMHPFQRNHVSYAAQLSLFFPYLLFVAWSYARGRFVRRFLLGFAGFIVVAVYFSYTRAAYLALLTVPAGYFVFRWRLIKPLLMVASLAAVLGIAYSINENKYLAYAPNYDRTISHENFDNLIEATYKLEDISTMERLYR